MSVGQPIGIDFGTTKTLVYRWDERSQRPVPIHLGRGSGDALPTTIHVDGRGNFLFGEDADDNRVTDSSGYIARFKRDLQTNSPKQIHGRSFTPLELSSKFLAHIRERVEEEAIHGPVSHAVLTVPALYGPAAKAHLKKAAEQAGFTDFELLDEPVAGGRAFLHDHADTVAGQNFLVFDWGGGTLDLAVIRRNRGIFSSISELIGGDPRLGGEDIDDTVEQGVSGILKGQNRKELRSQPDEFLIKALGVIKAGKVLLSRKPDHRFRFTLNDGPLEFQWKREEFERYIQDTVNEAVSLTKQLIQKAAIHSLCIDAIILIGGSSEIPVVRRNLEEVTGITTVRYDLAQQAVAIGAALHAHSGAHQKRESVSVATTARELSSSKSKRRKTIEQVHDVGCPRCNKLQTFDYGTKIYGCYFCKGNIELTVSCPNPKCRQKLQLDDWQMAECPKCETPFDAWYEARVAMAETPTLRPAGTARGNDCPAPIYVQFPTTQEENIMPSSESTPLTWKQILFSFEGRIPRRQYWAGLGILLFITVAAVWFMGAVLVIGMVDNLNSSEPLLPVWIVTFGIALWISLALGVKRYHDLDKSGWWMLLGAIPYIGGIWQLIECGCLRGTEGSNRFGADLT